MTGPEAPDHATRQATPPLHPRANAIGHARRSAAGALAVAAGLRHGGACPTLTPAALRHLQRFAGNAATASFLQRGHRPVVARQDAGAGAAAAPGSGGLPARGSKEYQDKAEKSPEPGPPPKIGNLVPAPLKGPGAKYESDPKSIVKWNLGRQSVNIPVVLPGVGLSAGIGGSLEANANLSGKLSAEWRRIANISPLPYPVMDYVSVKGTLNAGGHVAGGLHAFVGAGVKGLAEGRVKVGGSAELDGAGQVTISGTAGRNADPLAQQFEPWTTGGEVSFDFTGQLIIAATAAFEWSVLVVGEGEERLFTIGRFAAGTVKASGQLAYVGGELVAKGLQLTVGSAVTAQQVKGNTGPPKAPAQTQRLTATESRPIVQRAPVPDEDKGETAAVAPRAASPDPRAEQPQGPDSVEPTRPEDERKRVDEMKQEAASVAAELAASQGGVLSAMAPSEGEEGAG